MLKTLKGPMHDLNAVVLIKRWKVKGTIIARSFSPLRYDIQCPKKLHRGIPEEWIEPNAASSCRTGKRRA